MARDLVGLEAAKLQVEALIERIKSEATHIAGLVNAAGYFFSKPFLEQTPEDYRNYADLNQSTFFLTQPVTDNMKANGGGAIVTIGSFVGEIGS